MDKSLIQTTLNKMRAAGITSWRAFCRGGNYELRHNGNDTFNILSDNAIIHLKDINCYDNLSGKAQFEVDIVPYDNIDYVAPIGLTLKETEDVLKALSVNDPKVYEFLYKNTRTYHVNTGSKRLSDGFITDNDGKEVTQLTGKSAYIVGADADRRTDNAIGKDNTTPLEDVKKNWHTVVKEKPQTD